MKKLILSIIAFSLLIFANELKAQCSPDTSIHSTGVYPEVIDSAIINVPYNQVIQYYITKDTTVVFSGNTINATIDSLTLTGVKGLPAGFTYECPNGNCTVKGAQTGCVTLKGKAVALQGGTYPLTVYLTIYAKAFLGPIPVSQSVNDSNSRYHLIVKTPAGVGNTNALEGAFVYPNPAKDYLQFYAPNAKGTIKYAIFNLNGALVLNGESIDNSNVSQISLASLSKGIYMLQLNNGENQLLKKFIVE